MYIKHSPLYPSVRGKCLGRLLLEGQLYSLLLCLHPSFFTFFHHFLWLSNCLCVKTFFNISIFHLPPPYNIQVSLSHFAVCSEVHSHAGLVRGGGKCLGSSGGACGWVVWS
jgi:hypothetical protein